VCESGTDRSVIEASWPGALSAPLTDTAHSPCSDILPKNYAYVLRVSKTTTTQPMGAF